MMHKNIKLRILFIMIFFLVFIIPIPRVSGKNAIYYNKQGWKFLKKGDNIRAIFNFKNALKNNAKYKDALIGLGKAYYEVEAYEQAYDLFNLALKIDKKSSEAYVGLGKTLIGMGNYTGALSYFTKAEKISEDNIDAKYGIAYLYYIMGKKISAKRSLNTIFKINPYHYDALLLMAELKSDEKRLNEAKKYIDKAIESNSEYPKGYIKLGEILFHQYLINENMDYIEEASFALKNAISIQPNSYHANRIMGYISLIKNNNSDAVNYFKNALIESADNSSIFYCLAISYDLSNNVETALKVFSEAYKRFPSDSILKNRFEDFLVTRDFRIGHPERILFYQKNYNLAALKTEKNFPDQVVMYLRRAILLNPMNTEARELLMDYYYVRDYNRFYIDEMKDLLRLFPGNKYQEKLNVEIIKRRDRLYHKEGYSAELPVRDVPNILVFNFDSDGKITPHPDAGEVIASNLTFVMGQFGRMNVIGIRKRAAVTFGLKFGDDHVEDSFEEIGKKIKAGEIDSIDYVVYGKYYESGNRITLECKLLDFSKGFIIGEFSISETGSESLPILSLRSAKRIYDMVPFKGRILKVKDKGIVLNLGLYDGINPGDILVINKFNNSTFKINKIKKKILFKVKESDTIISYAEPQKNSELESVEENDIIYPLKKRRAKKIK